jgi:hypothetical protein
MVAAAKNRADEICLAFIKKKGLISKSRAENSL